MESTLKIHADAIRLQKIGVLDMFLMPSHPATKVLRHKHMKTNVKLLKHNISGVVDIFMIKTSKLWEN